MNFVRYLELRYELAIINFFVLHTNNINNRMVVRFQMDEINTKIIVTEYSTDFRKVTKLVKEPVPTPGPSQIVILNHYLGINASDIKYPCVSFRLSFFFSFILLNWTAGKYPPRPKLPFVAGIFHFK